MAKNKKPLLNEGTVRRMMKLANMDALGDGFINDTYTSLTEKHQPYGGNKGDESRSRRDYMEEEAELDETYGGNKGDESRSHRDYMEEDQPYGGNKGDESRSHRDYMEEEAGDDDKEELESELDATEDELGAEDKEADEEADELDAEADMGDGEVTITDDEAQDIIALADKLRNAVGEDDELAMDDEMAVDLDMDLGEQESPELYEAALKGLNLEIVEDKPAITAEAIQEIKRRVYERVVKRLISESKKTK
jgi:hypothetical protein